LPYCTRTIRIRRQLSQNTDPRPTQFVLAASRVAREGFTPISKRSQAPRSNSEEMLNPRN
jgi:hypothetical protein